MFSKSAQNQSMPTVTTEVPNTVDPEAEFEKRKEIEEITRQKEIDFTQKQIQWLQDKLTMLQRMAQSQNINQPAEDQFEALDRQEEQEQESLQQQQNVDLAQQVMQQNQQSQQMLNTMQQQQQMQKSSAYIHPERSNIKIAVNNMEIECDVAATPKQQATGLQVYDLLPRNKGLWFPLNTRRTASFHMGNVKFPIDIIFIDGNKINKIVANIQPRQMGSWSSTCTDVIEVNGGWCDNNGVQIGDVVDTPLTNKRRARSDIEKLLNTSYSAPQDARLTSSKSYDLLRTITEAQVDDDYDALKAELMQMFPHLKQAQENYKVKPDTHREQPGEVDTRDPTTRFEHNTLPDEFSPFGDGDGADIDPFSGTTNMPDGTDGGNSGVSPRHFQYTRGFDPSLDRYTPGEGYQHQDDPKFDGLKAPIRPSAQIVTVTSPSPDTELAGVDTTKLASGSIKLFDDQGPEWHDYSHDLNDDYGLGYEKMAVVTDRLISNWIDSLGFDEENEASLRKVMFTNEYKTMLGDALISAGKAKDYDLFDSDLLIYR